MRKILFRGKRKDTGKWVYGYYVCEDAMHAIMTVEKDGNSRLLWNEVDPETVGQWTGLKDKNGKDVYEGDIVQTKYEHMLPIAVEWKDGGFYYSPAKTNLEGSSFCVCEFTVSEDVVIGNIHDTPALLEVTK